MAGFLKRLFGGGGTPEGPAEPDRRAAVEHKGFTILPVARPTGGQFLTAAIIEKAGPDGVVRRHELIRADTHASLDDAKALAVAKAMKAIDEQGERLFG